MTPAKLIRRFFLAGEEPEEQEDRMRFAHGPCDMDEKGHKLIAPN